MTNALRLAPIAAVMLAAATVILMPSPNAFAQAEPLRDYQTQRPAEPQPRPTARPLREGVTGLGNNQGVIARPRFIVEVLGFSVVRGPPRQAPFRNNLPFSQSIFCGFRKRGSALDDAHIQPCPDRRHGDVSGDTELFLGCH